MPRPPNKSPSEPELEFGEAVLDGPTGRFKPVEVAPVPNALSARAGPQVETLPAPDAPSRGAPMVQGPPPPNPSQADANRLASPARPLARIPTQPRDPRKVHASEPRPAVRQPSAEDELFGALGKVRAMAADRPTADAPTRGVLGPAREKIAPLPPRLPTLGPEQEFSLGIEELPIPPPSTPPLKRRATSKSFGGGDDLSWDLKSGGGVPGNPSDPRFSGTPLPPATRDLGDAHALVERGSVPPALGSSVDSRRELGERYAMGDFSGALVIAEGILADGTPDKQVQSIADECRTRLQQMYSSRLGDLHQVPVLAVPRGELKWLSLDHRAGFVLSLVDGTSNMEEIIDVAGMPALEVLRMLYDLMIQRVIEFRRQR